MIVGAQPNILPQATSKEMGNFLSRDVPPRARLERPELDAAERHPQQARHLVSARLEQPPDLPIASLGELDDEVRLSL